VSTAEEMAGAWACAVEVDKAAYHVSRAALRRAKIVGMNITNWKHGGAGDNGPSSTPATTQNASPAGTGSGKWDNISTTETTSYYHTATTKWSRGDQEGSKK
jgi:hypothetical protein